MFITRLNTDGPLVVGRSLGLQRLGHCVHLLPLLVRACQTRGHLQGGGVLQLDVGTQRVEEAGGEQLGLLPFDYGLIAAEDCEELLLVRLHSAVSL